MGLLALVVIGWSAAWLVIRSQTQAGLDTWLAQEARQGRRWSCADRSFGGYPFRMEIRCSDFALDRPDVHASVGRLLVVSQVYSPRHIIAEASGPLALRAGDTTAAGSWRLLQASVIASDGGFDRLSLVTEDSSVTVSGGPTGPFELASRHFESHLRPDPDKPSAYDLAMRVDGARNAGLDGLFGGQEPADITVNLDVTNARNYEALPLGTELERWRSAGGRVEISSVTLAKGTKRVEISGDLGIDDRHRPQGSITASATELGGLLGQVLNQGGIGNILGALLGGGAPAASQKPGSATLKPLPPIRLDGGRLVVGPLPIPIFQLPALY